MSEINIALSAAYHQRFNGIARLYGHQALALFAGSHFCVIGLGGVGSWIAEALVRTGIGEITLIDLDDVCISNTNRQLHALQPHIGQAKTDVIAERLRQINPECRVHVIDDFITADNIKDYISTHVDYVMDAIDSIQAKAALLVYCRRNKIPVVCIGGAGGQIDPTQIKVADLAKTIQDPLAAKLRARLKSEYNMVKNSRGKLGIDCVYSTEPLRYPPRNDSDCVLPQARAASTRMDCATGLGASVMVTATFGFIATAHALQKIMSKARRNGMLNETN